MPATAGVIAPLSPRGAVRPVVGGPEQPASAGGGKHADDVTGVEAAAAAEERDADVPGIVRVRRRIRERGVGAPDVGLVDERHRSRIDARHANVRQRPARAQAVAGPHEAERAVGHPGSGDAPVGPAEPVVAVGAGGRVAATRRRRHADVGLGHGRGRLRPGEDRDLGARAMAREVHRIAGPLRAPQRAELGGGEDRVAEVHTPGQIIEREAEDHRSREGAGRGVERVRADVEEVVRERRVVVVEPLACPCGVHARGLEVPEHPVRIVERRTGVHGDPKHVGSRLLDVLQEPDHEIPGRIVDHRLVAAEATRGGRPEGVRALVVPGRAVVDRPRGVPVPRQEDAVLHDAEAGLADRRGLARRVGVGEADVAQERYGRHLGPF